MRKALLIYFQGRQHDAILCVSAVTSNYFLFPLVELSKIKTSLVLRMGQRVNKMCDGG